MTEARERLVAWSLFALLIIGGFRLPVSWLRHRPGPPNGLDRRPLRERDDPSPPQFRTFLESARSQTPPGATVSIDFAAPYDGFSYAYWRANYVLAGRRVLLPGDRSGEYVVSWPAARVVRQH